MKIGLDRYKQSDGDSMGRKAKVTDNVLVAEWLIQNRWLNSLNTDTKQQLPAFVDDAVWAAITIVAGVSDGKVNVSPKLVMKSLMLKTISTETVKVVEVGYDMSDRQAQRLAQTARFALDGIRHRIQEYESNVSEHTKMIWRLEKKFLEDYYKGRESPLYSKPLPPAPEHILSLHSEGDYLEYAIQLQKWRISVGVYKEDQ
jgi:hypothetical protein